MQSHDNSVTTANVEKKELPNLMKDNKNATNTVVMATMDYSNYETTKDLFPMALRFKIAAMTTEDAHNKHITTLQAIAKHTQH